METDVNRLDVAVAAIWLMYRRGQMARLARLGIDEAHIVEMERGLGESRLRHRTLRRITKRVERSDGRWYDVTEIDHREVLAVTRACPYILTAAAKLLALYSVCAD